MIICGDLLLVLLSCLIISAKAGPLGGRRTRPGTSTAPLVSVDDEDPYESASMVENKSPNDHEDDVILASDIVYENGKLTESENVVNVSEDATNKTLETKDSNSEDLASKDIVYMADGYQSENILRNIETEEDDAREEKIVNKAGQARNSIRPGGQKPVIMQPQFANEEPLRPLYEEPSRPYYSTHPPRTTYYEYGNPEQILHRAQDRNDDYNVATSSPSPNLMNMDKDMVLEVELDTTTSNGGGLWNWLISWFQ